jgi:hypothetical protein
MSDERLVRETDLAWLGYTCYRDLGPARTVRGAWQEYSDKKSRKVSKSLSGTSSHFKKWFVENDWNSRAIAWDQAQESATRLDLSRAKAEKYRAEIAEFRTVQLQSGKFGSAAARDIKAMVNVLIAEANPDRKSSQIKAIDEKTAARIERLARVAQLLDSGSAAQWAKALAIDKLLEDHLNNAQTV